MFDLDSKQEVDNLLYYDKLTGDDQKFETSFTSYILRDQDKRGFTKFWDESDKKFWNIIDFKITCSPCQTIYTKPVLYEK